MGLFAKQSLHMILDSRRYTQSKEVPSGFQECHSLFQRNCLEVAKPMFSAENKMRAVKLT